jgi:hypothetical protein
VVTHKAPASGEHAGTAPFTFVDGVEAAIRAAREYAGDRVVDVAGGEIGGQALRLGPHRSGGGQSCSRGVRLRPSVLRDRPAARPDTFDNPAQVVPGDRVTHLVYDVTNR